MLKSSHFFQSKDLKKIVIKLKILNFTRNLDHLWSKNNVNVYTTFFIGKAIILGDKSDPKVEESEKKKRQSYV